VRGSRGYLVGRRVMAVHAALPTGEVFGETDGVWQLGNGQCRELVFTSVHEATRTVERVTWDVSLNRFHYWTRRGVAPGPAALQVKESVWCDPPRRAAAIRRGRAVYCSAAFLEIGQLAHLIGETVELLIEGGVATPRRYVEHHTQGSVVQLCTAQGAARLIVSPGRRIGAPHPPVSYDRPHDDGSFGAWLGSLDHPYFGSFRVAATQRLPFGKAGWSGSRVSGKSGLVLLGGGCLSHEDCVGNAELGRACFEATRARRGPDGMLKGAP